MGRVVVCVILGLLAPTAALFAQEPVHFTDANLEVAVEAALGKTDPTPTDMLALTALFASNRSITDLTGLEYATNLSDLRLGYNQISDISPLAGLTNLDWLYLEWNQISDISPLAGQTNLSELLLWHNQISDISILAGLANLNWLDLGDNQISDLSPLAGLTNLTILDIWNNQITDISPLTGLTNLTSLELGYNQISDLSPLAGLTNLDQLYLEWNRISDTSPLAGLTNLNWLYLGDNEITVISPLAGLTNLTTLDISYNEIADISPLTGLTNLNRLHIEWNQISDVAPLANLTNLTLLDLNDNGVSNIASLAGLTNLNWLYLADNQISDISPLAGLTNLIRLNLGYNQFCDISPLAGLTNLTLLDLWYNQISNISPLAGLPRINTLDLADNLISDISPLAGLTNLTSLLLKGNPLNAEICDVYIPMIVTNNSGISISYGPCVIQDQTLTISSKTGGYVSMPGEGTFMHDKGRVLRVSAQPYAGFRFSHWSGTAVDMGKVSSVHSSFITVTVDGDCTLVANFVSFQPLPIYTLTISSNTGGYVSTPGEGAFEYNAGAYVQLEAKANPGYRFTHWSDSISVAENPTTIVIKQDDSVRANFVSILDVIYVDNDAPNDPGPCDSSQSDPDEDGTPKHPFDTIQEAIDVAAPHAQVAVWPGVYVENIDLLGKSIVVTGLAGHDPNVASYPVIDGNSVAPTVTFASGEDANCVVTGFVITGGWGQQAGGVYCDNSNPTLTACLIAGNRAVAGGGGLYGVNSDAVLANCTLSGNDGGPDGAGLYAIDSNCVLLDSILWNNTPSEILTTGTSDLYLAYCDIANGRPGESITAADPLFAASGYWAHRDDMTALIEPADPNAMWMPGDYHLRSQAGRWDPLDGGWTTDDITSPCIDAGDPNAPVGDEPQPHGGRINLGAYGGALEASKSASE